MNEERYLKAEATLKKPKREIPMDIEDAVLQLWTFMIGLNGDGFASRFEKFENMILKRLDDFMTKADCDLHQTKLKELEEKRKRFWRNVERIIFLTLAILGFIFGNEIISYFKKG